MRIVTLLKIPAGLSPADHELASEKIVSEGLDGLELSCYGGAYGPVWDTREDYDDLGFLRHYRRVQRLHLGIRLKSLDGIQAIATSLEDLSLYQPPGGDTNVSLSPLVDCRGITSFGTGWRGLDLQPVEQLPGLVTLRVRSAGAAGFALACSLRKLTRLHLSFIAIERLSGLENLARLEHLGLSYIRGLQGLGELAQLRSLRTARLDCLAQVRALPDLSAHQQLGTLICSTMKALQELDGIRGSAIRELALIDVRTPLEAVARIGHDLPRLEHVVLHLGGRKQTEAAGRLFDPKLVAESTNAFSHFHSYGTRHNTVAFHPRFADLTIRSRNQKQR